MDHAASQADEADEALGGTPLAIHDRPGRGAHPRVRWRQEGACGEAPTSRVLGAFVSERLRRGSGTLLRGLVAERHDLWVYTTSLRPAWRIRLLFRSYGVPLAGVINQTVHDRLRPQDVVGAALPGKFPPAFGIDLLVDDSSGVAAEGQALGFRVLVVTPSQDGWADEVRTACRSNRERH
jgi:hypothetical protein